MYIYIYTRMQDIKGMCWGKNKIHTPPALQGSQSPRCVQGRTTTSGKESTNSTRLRKVSASGWDSL